MTKPKSKLEDRPRNDEIILVMRAVWNISCITLTCAQKYMSRKNEQRICLEEPITTISDVDPPHTIISTESKSEPQIVVSPSPEPKISDSPVETYANTTVLETPLSQPQPQQAEYPRYRLVGGHRQTHTETLSKNIPSDNQP